MDWKAERIENRISAGTPDVFFTIGNTHGMVELKYLPKKRKTVTISHFTDEQRSFAYRHNTFILTRIEDDFFLHSGECALLLGRGELWATFQDLSVGFWHKKIDFAVLRRLLAKESNTK